MKITCPILPLARTNEAKPGIITRLDDRLLSLYQNRSMDVVFEWVKVPVANLHKNEHGNIYLIPFHPHQGLHARHITKIGCGSSFRIARVIKEAREAGMELFGDSVFVCNTAAAFESEKLLHRRFYKRRITQETALNFSGSTELFDVSIAAIKRIKSLNHRHDEVPPDHAPLLKKNFHERYIQDGLLLCDLYEKLSPPLIESGDIKIRLHRTGYRSPLNANSLHAIRIDWFTFTGMSPLEAWGNPQKYSPEWEQLVNELNNFQSRTTKFLDQWSLTNEGYFDVVERMIANEFISLNDLTKLPPSHAVQVARLL